MNMSPRDDSATSELAGLSRRTIVGAGATGLALALLARAYSQAGAQEATPSTGGMPPGTALIPLIDVPIPVADVPHGAFKLSIYRITLEPGSVVPNSSLTYPDMAFVETGTLICPGEAPRYLIHADGSVEEVGNEDVTVNTGEAIYIPPNVVDGARNDGKELLTILAVDLLPIEAIATPAS
jgi:hypothetical protein